MEYGVSGNTKDSYETLLRDTDYKNSINLNNVSVEDAISSDVWQGIVNSWDSDNPVPRCMQVCKQMKRDTFIKEDL